MKQKLIIANIAIIILLIIVQIALADNDPGHDTLYIEQEGDSGLNGSLNITNNLTLQSTSKLKQGGVLTLYADGSTPGTGSYISATGNPNYDLYIDTQGSIYFKSLTTGMMFIGLTGSTPTSLNISGALYLNGSNNKLDTGPAAIESGLDLYWGDKLLCDASESNCGWVTSLTGGGDISSVQSGDTYIYNGSDTGDVYLRFNESKLNATIEAKSSTTGGGWTDSGTTVSLITSTDNVSANTLSVDNTNERVGIGTTSPGEKLEVSTAVGSADGIKISRNADTGSLAGDYEQLLFTSRTNDYGTAIRSIQAADAGQWLNPRLGFFVQNEGTNELTDMTEKMSILGDGNVGIGTTDPQFPLDVNGSMRLGASGSIYTTSGGLYLIPASQEVMVFDNANAMKLSIYNNNALNIRLDAGGTSYFNGGNVGIGMASPTAKLHVNGSINVTSGNDFCIDSGTCLSTVSGSAGGWTDSGTTVSLTTSTDNVSANTLHIDNTNGRIGIGTASPTQELDVNGSITTNDNMYFSGAGGTGLYLYASYIYGTGATIKSWNGEALETVATIQSGDGAGTARFEINQGKLTGALEGNGQNITGLGYVGIGTTSPGQTLTVIGGVNATLNVSTPQVCLNGNCRTTWPSGVGNCSVDGSCSLITYDSETTNWDKTSSDDITTSSTWTGGDLSGTGLAPQVTDSSHAHSCLNITGATSNLCTITDTTGGNLSAQGATPGYIPQFQNGTVLNNSIISQSASALTIGGNVNLTTYNVSAVNCIVFNTGGKICSGA